VLYMDSKSKRCRLPKLRLRLNPLHGMARQTWPRRRLPQNRNLSTICTIRTIMSTLWCMQQLLVCYSHRIVSTSFAWPCCGQSKRGRHETTGHGRQSTTQQQRTRCYSLVINDQEIRYAMAPIVGASDYAFRMLVRGYSDEPILDIHLCYIPRNYCRTKRFDGTTWISATIGMMTNHSSCRIRS
jgi:hypothetical protein